MAVAAAIVVVVVVLLKYKSAKDVTALQCRSLKHICLSAQCVSSISL